MDMTEYLAACITANREALRQARSLITEPGYEAEAADRLHKWVDDHMKVILSPPVVSNPYTLPWPTWMKVILTDALSHVKWEELVSRLK